MNPGAMALTVMFCRASSRAETLVSAMIAGLARGIIRLAEQSHLSADRRQIDRSSAVVQNRDRFLGDVECAGEIHAHDAFEFFERHLLDRAVADDPGIVDQDVEPADVAPGFASSSPRPDRAWLRRTRSPAVPSIPCDRIRASALFCPCGIGDVIDHAFRAARAEGFDHFRADAARAAGDEHDFSGEIEWVIHGQDSSACFLSEKGDAQSATIGKPIKNMCTQNGSQVPREAKGARSG